MIEGSKFLLAELYVIVDYGYHGDPNSKEHAYTSKEEAQAVVDKAKITYPKLHYIVKDLQSYIWENRRYKAHQCEIC